MSAITQKTTQKPEAATVLSKTFACAGERLDISRTLLAKLPGVSPATITRLYSVNPPSSLLRSRLGDEDQSRGETPRTYHNNIPLLPY